MKRAKLAAVSGRVLLTAASYRRVSRGGQDPENQRADLERIARARGLELEHEHEYCEAVSGAAVTRPAFDEMMLAASRGEFRVLLVWAIDRFGRSMARNIHDVLELDRLGVQVVSVREPWLDTGGPVRDLLLAIFSWVAEQERRRLGERTRAGLERARARGQRLGRPRRMLTSAELERARALWKVGVPIRKLAQKMKLPRATLHRLVSEMEPARKGGKPRAGRGTTSAAQKRTIGGR